MASIKDLRKRIASVKNTQQTTKAMKMVSAAKLRRAQEAITAHRPYAKKLNEFTHTIAQSLGEKANSVYVTTEDRPNSEKNLLLVVFTSDRGLCGGFNASIIKGTQRWLMANKAEYRSIKVSFVGKKAYEFFKTKNVAIDEYYQEAGGKVSFQKARNLTNALLKKYRDGEFTDVVILFNEFKNAMSQKLTFEEFLPLNAQAKSEIFQEVAATSGSAHGHTEGSQGVDLGNMILKPAAEELFPSLLEKHFPAQIYRVLLESQAGEHGARMAAMDNATRNAGEMIKKLTLQYNKQRQAGITKELLEIIGGSEAQKGA